jgi:SAM-dependent methyltransferase
MIILPPGNILQNMYLTSTIKNNNWNNFLEIGSGNGYVSNLLLNNGLVGKGCDLNASACENNQQINQESISVGKYEVLNTDFMDINYSSKFDLIISCMVIEHIESIPLAHFINNCKELLSENGSLVLMVPSGMKYWGVEDEIAGHIKRYEFEDFEKMATQHKLKVVELAGLTYPLSNWLLKPSNSLIKKNESKVLTMSQKEKTIYTGNRDVPFKTTFPKPFGLILNKYTMFPFHVLQLLNKKSRNSLIMFAHLRNS